MLNNQTPDAIRSAWQADIEAHLEADQTPMLHMGVTHQILDGAPGLLALHALAAARFDITAPVALAGGSSPLWLAALMHGRPADHPEGSPDVRLIYAGADAATYMASRTLHADGDGPLGRDAFLRPPAGLPSAMVERFAPTAEPGVGAPEETLPFYTSARALRERMDQTLPSPPYSTTGNPANWTAYAAIMLAVILVLAAVVLSLQP